LSLRPIAVAECAGLVFVRPGGAAAIDIGATLGGLEDELGDYHFDGFHRFGTWTSRWRCNYKLILDTFLEAYHVFALHKTTVARYFITAPSTFEPFGPNLRYLSLQKNFPELAQLPEDQWDLDARATIEYFIAPNTILSHSIDHLAVYRFLPQSVDDTISEMTVYTPAPVTTDEGRTHYDRTIELHKKVSGGEDFITQERIQRSLASGMVAETIFGRNEPAAIHFHEQLRALLAE
jgi:phenylpropionate dioxygenase-like ring-hydroxylating dioxygenase large terminal subunit